MIDEGQQETLEVIAAMHAVDPEGAALVVGELAELAGGDLPDLSLYANPAPATEPDAKPEIAWLLAGTFYVASERRRVRILVFGKDALDAARNLVKSARR
jgi:hypothetical protein